jgi:hypothetical protein
MLLLWCATYDHEWFGLPGHYWKVVDPDSNDIRMKEKIDWFASYLVCIYRSAIMSCGDRLKIHVRSREFLEVSKMPVISWA